MVASTPFAPNISKEDMDRLIYACAEACGVGIEIVEKICPASEEQIHRMEHHISTGSYMMQVVLHHEGNLDQSFLLRVLSAIRFKNHILRTKLIKYEGNVYQVILKDSLVFHQVGASLQMFLAQNSQVRMGYGTPLLRYAFVREPHGDSFFVWSIHCSAVDGWYVPLASIRDLVFDFNRTLCMIFDDLQTACSDLTAYCKLPPRPPYGRYARMLEFGAYETGRIFWSTFHEDFDNIKHKFPVLGLGGTASASTMKIKKLLHLPKVKNTEFSLETMGHAAWALTIARFQKPKDHWLRSADISLISLISARRSKVVGIKNTMGPLSARVPLRIQLCPNLSIESLMRDIENQFTSMIGFEHCAMSVLCNKVGLQDMLKQAIFSWNPPGSDVSSKRIICYDKTVAPAVLEYREDLSVPYAHDYGLLFEVYEHGEHIAIYASWDYTLVSADLISRLFEDFGSFLLLIIKTQSLTVQELL